MHLFYVDPGLVSHTGHHASCCRAFLREAHSRGIATTVLAGAAVEDAIRAEFGALPLFRAGPYYVDAGDPLCGWLQAFLRGAELTAADYSRLSRFSRDDVFFVTGCAPAQLMGLVNWLGKFPEGQASAVVVELQFHSGMVLKGEGAEQTWEPADPRQDARAVLYRFVGQHMKGLALPTLRFVTMNPAWPQVYETLLFKPVEISAGLPYAIPSQLIDRAGRRPLTVGMVGHQRPDKGLLLLPDLFSTLLKTHTDLRIILHNSGPAKLREPGTETALRALAAGNSRFILDERPLDAAAYLALLASIDLMLCPYDPTVYRANLSGILLECLANGIPVVVPGGTMLETYTKPFGDVAATFDAFTAPAIAAAATRAIARFDHHATAAQSAARTFAQYCGPDKFLDNVLRLAAQSSPSATS